MLFWRRKGKELKDVEKEVVPPKEEAHKETPKKEVPKRVEPVEAVPAVSRRKSPWGQAIPLEVKLLGLQTLDAGLNQKEVAQLLSVWVGTLWDWKNLSDARGVEALRKTASSPQVAKRERKRRRLTAHGVLWSTDGAGFRQGNSKHELLAVHDDFSRYTVNTKLASGPAQVDDVVLNLEQAFGAHEAPLVLRRHGGIVFQNVQVQELLAKYQVESLTGPRHYPQYNGPREQAFRDLRCFEQALRRHDPVLRLSLWLQIALHDPHEERPRPVSRARTAAEDFQSRQRLVDRKLFRQEVESTHKKLLGSASISKRARISRPHTVQQILLGASSNSCCGGSSTLVKPV